MSGKEPVWVLLGGRTGDNNQLLRLAEALGIPFRVIELNYSPLHLIPPRLLGSTLATLTRKSKAQIRPPWPQLVLGVGHRSVPVALEIRNLSGGKTKLVRVGNPRLHPRNFDLVITTAQYPVPKMSNVICLPVGIPTNLHVKPTDAEREWLERLPRAHRLLLVGGNSFMWTLRPKDVASAATEIAEKGGSIVALKSPRSDKRVVAAVEAAIASDVLSTSPRYPVLLADADEIYVTGDSVSMISDAIATGKPVGIIRPTKTLMGSFLYSLARAIGRTVPVRDIERFMNSVLDHEAAGTVEKPSAAALQTDSLARAVAAIRQLFGHPSARAC